MEARMTTPRETDERLAAVAAWRRAGPLQGWEVVGHHLDRAGSEEPPPRLLP